MESSSESGDSSQCFFETLQEMDRNRERRRVIKGDIDGPLFSSAEYRMVVRIGIMPDRRFKRGRLFGSQRPELADMVFMGDDRWL